MKTVCINQSKFNKVLGYGSWGIITFSLISFFILSTMEVNSMYEKDNAIIGIPRGLMIYYIQTHGYCYTTILTHEELCGFDNSSTRNPTLLIGNIINFIVIAFWIYYKQQKFRFSWCLKDGSES